MGSPATQLLEDFHSGGADAKTLVTIHFLFGSAFVLVEWEASEFILGKTYFFLRTFKDLAANGGT
jgi:hypothetical protein